MIIQGHALEELKKMEAESVNCIITSPPYWSLRKYDIPDVIFDGVEGCEHEWGKDLPPKIIRGSLTNKENMKEVFIHSIEDAHLKTGNFCQLCGAWRGQLGLEPTLDLYLKHLLEIMDECKGVLRDDGTMWVNIGDFYGSGTGAGGKLLGRDKRDENKVWGNQPIKGFEKSLCLIPYRFAIAMIDRGWICRNVIIWHKPNCMPSSAKDRFTVDFEPIYFFVKSRKYWFEQQYEISVDPENYSGRRPWNAPTIAKFDLKNCQVAGKIKNGKLNDVGRTYPNRNKRCVWTIPTQPYPESHFATFPEDLVEPMIRAGCPKDICVKCDKPKIIIHKNIGGSFNYRVRDAKKKGSQCPQFKATEEEIEKYYSNEPNHHIHPIVDIKEISCGCNAGWKSGVVLDPFCGSGTVIKVAEKLQRTGIGVDLGYQELSEKRRKWNQMELLI